MVPRLDSLQDDMLHPETTYAPIFILGIMQRSGTNFLQNLLLLHQDCAVGGAVWEDFFLAHSQLLVKYTDRVYKSWHPNWKAKVEEELGPDPICRLLGDTLLSFLQLQVRRIKTPQLPPVICDPERDSGKGSKKMTSVTPSVKNLPIFFRLFPRADLLIVIRDGRSLVESGMKTFGWDFELAVRRWAAGARTILEFCQEVKESDAKYLVVRFEDLHTDTKKEMRRILSFVELDAEKYDFERAANMFVCGSSELRTSSGKVYWQLVEKPTKFNPVKRWGQWGRSKHERFNWIAGDYSEELGYKIQKAKKCEMFWVMWNMLLDKIHDTEHRMRYRRISLWRTVFRLRLFVFCRLGKYLEERLS